MTSNRQLIIAPSILAADLSMLGSEIDDMTNGGADWIHVDVMDGNFVPPITFGENAIKVARSSCKLPIDVHLMVDHPESHFTSFVAAGASRLTIHQEACQHLHRSIQAINDLGVSAGVAINPATPISAIEHVLDLVDLVLVMTVNPGWGGQRFIDSCLTKIEQLGELISKRNYTALIEVDGGINQISAPLCWKAGANVFVAGSYIFSEKDRTSAISNLRSAISRNG